MESDVTLWTFKAIGVVILRKSSLRKLNQIRSFKNWVRWRWSFSLQRASDLVKTTADTPRRGTLKSSGNRCCYSHNGSWSQNRGEIEDSDSLKEKVRLAIANIDNALSIPEFASHTTQQNVSGSMFADEDHYRGPTRPFQTLLWPIRSHVRRKTSSETGKVRTKEVWRWSSRRADANSIKLWWGSRNFEGLIWK